jgi:hypothetical protein
MSRIQIASLGIVWNRAQAATPAVKRERAASAAAVFKALIRSPHDELVLTDWDLTRRFRL